MNVATFATAMERLGNYLDGMLDYYADHKNEMLAYKAEYDAEMRRPAAG